MYTMTRDHKFIDLPCLIQFAAELHIEEGTIEIALSALDEIFSLWFRCTNFLLPFRCWQNKQECPQANAVGQHGIMVSS